MKTPPTSAAELPLTRRDVARLALAGWIGCSADTQALHAQEMTPPPTKSQEQPTEEEQGPKFNGKDLDGWRVVDKHFFDRHGKVTWREGAAVLEAGQPGTAIAWMRELPRINYEVSLEAKRITGDDFFCGLTFPIANEYCTLIVGGWGGGTTGLSNIDGYSAVENETTDYVETRQNQWHRVRLKVTTARIQAWIDNRTIVDVDSRGKRFSIWWEQEPVCPFGLATWNTTAALRNLTVRGVARNPQDTKATQSR